MEEGNDNSESDAIFSTLDQIGQKLVKIDNGDGDDENLIELLIELTKAYNSQEGPFWFDQVLSLPMCLHLKRETLKKLLHE